MKDMGDFCSAIGCRNNCIDNPEKSFFHFPFEESRCRMWVENTKREDLLQRDAKYLSYTCRLCSDHFEENMFQQGNKRRLKIYAVPTLFEIPNALPKPIIERQSTTGGVDEPENGPKETASQDQPSNGSGSSSIVEAPEETGRQGAIAAGRVRYIVPINSKGDETQRSVNGEGSRNSIHKSYELWMQQRTRSTRHCCIPFCKSTRWTKPRVTFHEFPVSPERRKRWIKLVARQGKTKDSYWVPSDKSVVCSLHFRPTDFRQGLKVTRLLPNVSPSIFQHYPSYMQPKLKSERRIIKKHSLENVPKKKRKPKETTETLENGNSEIQQACDVSSCAPADSEEVTESPVEIEPRTMDAEVQVGRPQQKDVQTQTSDDIIVKFTKVKKEIAKLRVQLSRRNKKLQSLKDELDATKEKMEVTSKSPHVKNLFKLIQAAEEDGSRTGSFILEQLSNFGKKQARWSKPMLQLCHVWRKKSALGYEFPRVKQLLLLPSYGTIRRHLNPAQQVTAEMQPIEDDACEDAEETEATLHAQQNIDIPNSVTTLQTGVIQGLNTLPSIPLDTVSTQVEKAFTPNYDMPVTRDEPVFSTQQDVVLADRVEPALPMEQEEVLASVCEQPLPMQQEAILGSGIATLVVGDMLAGESIETIQTEVVIEDGVETFVLSGLPIL